MVPGILFMSCILLTIPLNSTSTPLAFSVIALVGMLASHLRSWSGVAISSAILLLSMFYFLQAQPSSSWVWTIALSLSIAATFVTTALCSDEAYHAWDALKQDETDHRQTILHLNEKLQALQNRLGNENKEPHSQVHILQEQLSAQEEQHRLDLNRLHAAFEELKEYEEKLRLQEEQQQLYQQDLMALEAQINEYKEKLASRQEEQETAYENWQASVEQQKKWEDQLRLHQEQQKIYENKQRSYEEKQRANEQVLKLARNEVITAHANQEKLLQEMQALRSDYECLSTAHELARNEVMTAHANQEKLLQELQTLQSDYESLSIAHEQLKHNPELEQLKNDYNKLINEYKRLESDYGKLNSEKEKQGQSSGEGVIDMRELRRMEGLYQQLRSQFEEKTDVLNATRKELFIAQENLLAAKKELEESSLKNESNTIKALRQQLADAEEEGIALEKQHASEVQQLHDLIDSLMSKG